MTGESETLRAERPPRRAPVRGLPLAGLVLTLLACAACRGAERSPNDPLQAESVVVGGGAVTTAQVAADFQPAFRALQAAILEGEDSLAGRILDGIRARDPKGDELKLAQDYERILRGRALVRSLDLWLESEADGTPGRHHLFLVLSHRIDADVMLRLPPGKLRRRRSAIDPDGFEQGELETKLVNVFDDVTLAPGLERRVELMEYTVPMGRALAQRERWSLDVLSGELMVGGELFPASGVHVEALETTFLAPFLPAQPVEPQVLAAYVAREEIFLPPLLERAVRIAPSRREEALAALLPVLEAQRGMAEERMAKIAPALRWLAGTNAPGVDVVAWIRHLRVRFSPAAAPPERPARPTLDLPVDKGGEPPAVRDEE